MGLPFISSKIAPDLRQFLDRVREFVSQADTGFARKRDLASAGVITTDASGSIIGGSPATTSGAVPPAPTGFSVTAALANCILEWDDNTFSNYAFTEIWRADIDDLSIAVKVAASDINYYADDVGETDVERFYWIRGVSKAGVVGPFNGTAGTSDTTLQVLESHIADFAVTNAKIGNLAVDAAKIANATIVSAKIGTGEIKTANIDTAAITSAKIGNGEIKTANIDTAQVTTLKIGADQVTVPVSAYASAGVTATSSAEVTAVSVSTTTTGAPVNISVSSYYGMTCGAGATFMFATFLLYRGATLLTSWNLGGKTLSSGGIVNGDIGAFGASYQDTPAAGTYTYAMKISIFTDGATPDLESFSNSILCLETKR